MSLSVVGSDAPMTGARVPPHNLQAEESLLGAMLLRSQAIADAVQMVHAEDFYKPAHGHVFEAITSLYGGGQPVDPVTVAEELKRAGLLDAIGGPAVLLSIQSRTPAVSNAAHYAKIVEENSLLRRMVVTAGEIAELGYHPLDDVAKTVDAAEAMMYEIGQRRITDSMVELRDLLDQSLDRLEALYERDETITGTPSGYNDLDELLSGLQPNALIVVGARPAMGKTAFGLGAAANAAVKFNKPVLFFSLEMGHLELTQRLLGSEGRIDATRLRNGKLTEADWGKISKAMGRLAEAPLWIDDNPNLTVMEIRAKARRLKSKVGDLGLIVVDYLQLMSGRDRAENRQVEVSEISRGLKILARELECPVMALSQLSRALELRADKRPMLADLRESGCLTSTTRILRSDTNVEVEMGELLASGERDIPVWTLDDDWRLVEGTMSHVFPSGTKETFRLRLASGREVEATANHPFRTLDGWRSLGDLDVGDRIATPRAVATPDHIAPMDVDELVLLAHLLGDGCVLPRQPIHYTNADPANLDTVEEAAIRRFGCVPRRVAQDNHWHLYLPTDERLARGRLNPISVWWDEFGLHDTRSHQKFIPNRVFALPSEQVALFLRHLWATDGSLTIGRLRGREAVRIYYASSSRRLIEGVRSLLLRCGVLSRLKEVAGSPGRPGFQLHVVGAEPQRAFLEKIGSHGARGEAVPRALELLESIVPNPNADTIPTEVREFIVAAMDRSGMSHRGLAGAIEEDYCGSYMLGSASRPRASSRGRTARIAEALGDKDLAKLATSDVFWDSVASIEPVGRQPVFDATVLGTHNFVANGIVAHNSIEQDADVVIFLYRDEVYNADSADKGQAEVIVSKHRNGPTGVCRLAFLDYCTLFANMARTDD